MNSLWNGFKSLVTKAISTPILNPNMRSVASERFMATLLTLHNRNLRKLENLAEKKKKVSPLGGKPLAKGIILKNVIRRPRKPNSANRKCVLLKLSTGKEMVAFVPGIGHNLQEHQTVLVCVKKLKDTPGVKLRCIRGKYDLPLLKKNN